MNIIAIDDDKAALYILKKILIKIPGIETVETFSKSKEAEAYLLQHPAEILIVDIELDDDNGVALAKRIQGLYPEIILIFLTSHTEYALEAFDIYALDYMMKPISEERVRRTIEKAKLYIIKTEKPKYKLYVYCLGGCDVKNQDGRILKFLSSKSEELFYYLLSFKERTVGKWKIIEDLFPDMPRSNAEIYLNTTIYKLRKVLREAGLDEIIHSSNGGYLLKITDLYIDYEGFGSQITLSEPWEEKQILKAFATEQLFGGELYGDKDYPWSYYQREILTNCYINYAKGLCRYIISENITEHFQKVFNILMKLEALNELDQETAYLILEVLKKKKDYASLENYYIKFCRVLKKELGIHPDLALQTAYQKFRKNI